MRNDRMKIAIAPDWDKIEGVRHATHAFLSKQGVSESASQAVEMVACELIENAIKYGNFSSKGDEISICLQLDHQQVVLEISNPLDREGAENLNRLDRIIQWIRGFQDPFEAYVLRLEEVANKPLHDPESGLGIVRTAYEGGAVLDFFLAEDNFITISAVINVK